MIVGPSGSGKSTAWQVLLKALEHHEGIEGILDFFLLMFNISMF
jgi:ABC-type glutathione transport system ATPase component